MRPAPPVRAAMGWGVPCEAARGNSTDASIL